MVTFVGFDGPAPYSIIIWQRDGVDQSKTVCYSRDDEDAAINRFNSPSDFYNTYDQAIVVRENKPAELINKELAVS